MTILMLSTIVFGVAVMTFATASLRYYEQKVGSTLYDLIWLALPPLARHFVYYQTHKDKVRKSLFWRCDLYHFLDHLWAWGLAITVAGFSLLSFYIADDVSVFELIVVPSYVAEIVCRLAVALTIPIWRGWLLMFWLHVGLMPAVSNEYHWTLRQLFKYILLPHKAP